MDGRVTQKDIYLELKDFRREIMDMFKESEDRCRERYKELKVEVDDTTCWRNKLTGQITVIVAIVGLGINWLWDAINKKL